MKKKTKGRREKTERKGTRRKGELRKENKHRRDKRRPHTIQEKMKGVPLYKRQNKWYTHCAKKKWYTTEWYYTTEKV